MFASEDKEVHRLLVTGFYLHNEIPDRNNFSAMSNIVVEAFSNFYGVNFGPRQVYHIKTAQGLPDELSKGTRIRYECLQKVRVYQPSRHDYTRTRIRRRKMVRYPCRGQISVYFPHPETSASFDLAIDYEHSLHPGATFFGVPKVVRDWIRNNPRPSPLAQREDLLSAIAKGEVRGIEAGRYFSPSHISYWWRKGVAKTIYVSQDKWENVEHFLRNHPVVSRIYNPFLMD